MGSVADKPDSVQAIPGIEAQTINAWLKFRLDFGYAQSEKGVN